MDFQQLCRLRALQCVRWAATIDDVTQHLTFTLIARQWLDAAHAIALEPSSGERLLRARLH